MNQEAAFYAADLEQCRHQFDGAVIGDELTPCVFGEDTPMMLGMKMSMQKILMMTDLLVDG